MAAAAIANVYMDRESFAVVMVVRVSAMTRIYFVDDNGFSEMPDPLCGRRTKYSKAFPRCLVLAVFL